MNLLRQRLRTAQPTGGRALVLEGGGARGAFQAGVLWWLHDQGLTVDLACGTSVGALNAAAFAFGRVEEMVRLWESLTSAQVYRRRRWPELIWEFVSRRTWNHLYDNQPLRRILEQLFGERLLADSPIPLLISAFNLQTGEPVLFTRDTPLRVVDALLASSALQGLFPPHYLHGFQYIDGGNGLNLPLAPALAAGAHELWMVRTTASHELTPWLYKDVVAIQRRAYTVMLNRTTSSDLARASELSRLLSRWEFQRDLLRDQLQTLISAPRERAALLDFVDHLAPLEPTKTPVRLRVVEPPPGTPLPDLLDFEHLSPHLLRLGYQRAHLLLKEEEPDV